MRTHQPWQSAPPAGAPRSAPTTPTSSHFSPSTAGRQNAETFREEFICNATCRAPGAGWECSLSRCTARSWSTTRARWPATPTPNAGFVRDDAVLALVMVSDGGSARCATAAATPSGRACTDAVGVFRHLLAAVVEQRPNLRFYMYDPGPRRTRPGPRPTSPDDPRAQPRLPRSSPAAPTPWCSPPSPASHQPPDPMNGAQTTAIDRTSCPSAACPTDPTATPG